MSYRNNKNGFFTRIYSAGMADENSPVHLVPLTWLPRFHFMDENIVVPLPSKIFQIYQKIHV